MKDVFIVDGLRTAIGSLNGTLAPKSAVELGTTVVSAILEKNSLPGEAVDEVIFGNVLQAGQGQNVGRQVQVNAGIPIEKTAMTVNMVCASGMRAMDMARRGIILGDGSIYIAGGTESMSNVPFYVKETRWGHKLGSVTLIDGVMDEGLQCPITGMGMGMTAEEIASHAGITREEMDAWALRSQERARCWVK